MADILEGTTGHTHFAPLSHSQTLAVGRHLQDQIRQLQGRLDDFQHGLSETNDAVSDLRKTAGGANSALMSLQDGLAATKTAVETQRSELSRTNAGVQKLQGGLDKTNENVAKLGDGHKVTNMTLQKVTQDLADTTSLSRKLQEAIERKVEQDLLTLRDELSKSNLHIKNLKAEQDSLKAAAHDDRESMRQTDCKVKESIDKLSEAKTMLKIVEQRVADNTSGLRSTRLNLEDLNNATLKLHEDHENTKGHVTELHGNIKKVHSNVKQVHSKLDSTVQGLGLAQVKLDQQIENSEVLRQNVQDTHSRVLSLKEGHERASSMMSSLHKELAEVGATTQAVKAGLKEQSGLLLPNINMDSNEARMASARHGSLLVTNAAAFMNSTNASSPKKTPRSLNSTARSKDVSKELAWT